MVMTDIRIKVNAIITDKLGVDEATITQDAKFFEDLGADSLDIAEIIMEFENEFKITITDADAENIKPVGKKSYRNNPNRLKNEADFDSSVLDLCCVLTQ